MSGQPDIEFFQAITRRRRTLLDAPGQLELPSAEVFDGCASLGDAARMGEVIWLRAIDRCGLDRQRLAAMLGISHNVFGKQLRNEENQHLSWQRTLLTPKRFQRELAFAWIEAQELARISRVVEGL